VTSRSRVGLNGGGEGVDCGYGIGRFVASGGRAGIARCRERVRSSKSRGRVRRTPSRGMFAAAASDDQYFHSS